MTARCLVAGTLSRAPLEVHEEDTGRHYLLAFVSEGRNCERRQWRCFIFDESLMAEVRAMGHGEAIALSGAFSVEMVVSDWGVRLGFRLMVDAVLTTRGDRAPPTQAELPRWDDESEEVG